MASPHLSRYRMDYFNFRTPVSEGQDLSAMKSDMIPSLTSPSIPWRQINRPSPKVRLVNVDRRLNWNLLFPAVLLFAIAFGLSTFFLLWALLHQVSGVRQTGSFLLDEGDNADTGDIASDHSQLTTLTISSIISHIISVISPMFLVLYSSLVAARWLRNQESFSLHLTQQSANSEDTEQCPRPPEFGLLVHLLQSSGFLPLARSAAFFWRQRGQKSRVSILLSRVFMFAAYVFFMTHSVSICDLWLHTTTRSVITDVYYPVTSPSSYGFAFNDTLCPQGPLQDGRPCLTTQYGYGDIGQNADLVIQGQLIAANMSRFVMSEAYGLDGDVVLPAVQTLADADNMAIAVQAAAVDASLVFNTSSLGVRSQCVPLTTACLNLSGSMMSNIDCSATGYPQLPLPPPEQQYLSFRNGESGVIALMDNVTVGLVDGAYDVPAVYDGGATLATNPVQLLFQLTWESHTGLTEELTTSSIPCKFCDDLDTWVSLMACNVTWYNVTINRGAGGNYTLLQATESNPTFAAVLYAPLLYQYATAHLAAYVASLTIANTEEQLSGTFAAELSRQALSWAGATFVPTDTLDQVKVQAKIMGDYSVAAVMTTVALLYWYGLSALVLGLCAVAHSSTSVAFTSDDSYTLLEAARLRLMDPLALVSEVFPSQDTSLSLRKDALDMFEGPEDSPRVGIGMTWRAGKQRFGLLDLRLRGSKVIPEGFI